MLTIYEQQQPNRAQSRVNRGKMQQQHMCAQGCGIGRQSILQFFREVNGSEATTAPCLSKSTPNRPSPHVRTNFVAFGWYCCVDSLQTANEHQSH